MKLATLTKLLIFAVIQRLSYGNCGLTFYAEEISHHKASILDFYYTTTEASTVTECAIFCSRRQFCRTAVFNTISETCSISYDYVVSCRDRLKEEQIYGTPVQSHLVLIACVDSCFNSINDGLLTETRLNPAEWPLLDILLKNQPKGSRFKGNPYEETEEWLSKHIRKDSRIDQLGGEPQKGFWNKVIIDGIRQYLTDGTNSQSDVVKDMHQKTNLLLPGIRKCFEVVKKQTLLNAGFEVRKNISVEQCRCACASTWLKEDSTLVCKSFQYNDFSECLLNRANHHSKFDLVYDITAQYHFMNCTPSEFLKLVNQSCEISGVKTWMSKPEATFRHTFSSLYPVPKPEISKESIVTNSLIKNRAKVYRELTSIENLLARDDEAMAKKPAEDSTEVFQNNNNLAQNITDKDSMKDLDAKNSKDGLSSSDKAVSKLSKTNQNANPVKNNKHFVDKPTKVTKEDNEAPKPTADTATSLIKKKDSTPDQSTKNDLNKSQETHSEVKKNVTSVRDGNSSTTLLKSGTAGNNEWNIDKKSVLIFEPPKHSVSDAESTINVTSSIIVRKQPKNLTASQNITEMETTSKPENSITTFESTVENLTTVTTPLTTTTNSESATLKQQTEVKENGKNTNKNMLELKEEKKSKVLQKKLSETNSLENSNSSEKENEMIQLNVVNASKECFEVIKGSAMQGAAGGLEHNVSVEECMCICANSKNSGAFEFQCESATYYHNERDCVLNLENRQHLPELFGINTKIEYEVSYIGMLCSPGEALKQFANSKVSCFPIETLKVTTEYPDENEENLESGVFTDECFLELSDFVLEGTALAVEANVSVAQCKCYCVESEDRYKSVCLSMEYYFDSQTCLLNTENRLTNPSRFNYIPGTTMTYSYLDFQCAGKKNLADSYQQKCFQILSPPAELPKQNDEEDANIVDKSTDADREADNEKDDVKKAPKTDADGESDATNDDANKALIDKKDIEESTKKQEESEKLTPNEEIIEKEAKILLEKAAKEKLTEHKKTSTASEENHSSKPVIDGTATAKAKVKSETNVTANETTIAVTQTTETKPLDNSTIETDEEVNGNETNSTLLTNKEINNGTTTANATITPTTEEPTTTYSPVGRCTYSVLYQTFFKGSRMIKRFPVLSAAQCFAGCHHEGCRSINLVKNAEPSKFCELYKDALIDYRTPNKLGYDGTSAYFYGIQCNEKDAT